MRLGSQKKEMKLKLSGGENRARDYAPSLARCVKMLCAMLAFLLSLSLTATAKGQGSSLVETVYKKQHTYKLSLEDEILAERAVYLCLCASRTYERAQRSIKNAERLLVIERQLNIPEFMVGMSLAAACSESCFNEHAKGDHKFSKRGKPKAIGILQLWPWVEKYGVVRTNLESSATFWLSHIQRQLPKVKKRCKPRSKTLAWKQAWVTAVRAPKKGGRCREVTKHWRRFRKIQKVKEEIKDSFDDIMLEGDGC